MQSPSPKSTLCIEELWLCGLDCLERHTCVRLVRIVDSPWCRIFFLVGRIDLKNGAIFRRTKTLTFDLKCIKKICFAVNFSCKLIECHFLCTSSLLPLLRVQKIVEIDSWHAFARSTLDFFLVADYVGTRFLRLHGGKSVRIVFRYRFHFRLILVMIRFSIGIHFKPFTHHFHAFVNMFAQSFTVVLEYHVSNQPSHRILVVVRSVIRTLTCEMVFCPGP